MDGCSTAIVHLLNDFRYFEIRELQWWRTNAAQPNLWCFCSFRIKFSGSFEIAHEDLLKENDWIKKTKKAEI
jgi:hypothetical protein